MKRQGKILVLDDLEKWRDLLSDTLQRSGLHVDTAANINQVWERLKECFYHLIVLDISMDDDDQTNVEGMELLEALDDRFGPAIVIIMLSAYGTPAQMREAFRDHRVADFLAKEEFDNQIFRQHVEQMFKDKVVINLDLDIHWQDSSGLEEVVLDVKMNSHRIKGDSAQQARISAELDDLLCRLYHDASSLLVKPLKSGYSGARVLLVQPFYDDRGGGRADVVKFGHVRKIDQEYHNFTQYVRPFVGGGRQTEVRGLRRTMQLGGIVYTLLGTASDQLQEFDSYYRQADLDQIKQTLNHLFQDTCASWYANRGQLQPLDLTEEYQRALKFSPAELEPVLTEGLPLVQGKETLHFKALSGDRSFKNPILAAAKQHFVRSTYACITHGDLNQRNIMVDQAGHTWLIDFQYTEPSHILRDIVRLDSVVRIQLLSPEEATLSERLEMEETLCRIERFREVEFLPNSFQTENRALAKAYATAVHLRMLARKVIGHNPNDDFSEFHIASFYQALKMLQFHAMPMAQCEHALLSASLLAERLGL